MEIWELIARESIRDCIARWNSNGDAARFADMVMVLAPDVEFQATGSATIHGRENVLAYLGGVGDDKAPARVPVGRYLPAGGRPSIRHYTSTIQIDLASETSARVRSYYVVLSTFGLDHWGRYLDEFGVVDGEWLITKRTVTTEGVDPDGWAAVIVASHPDPPA